MQHCKAHPPPTLVSYPPHAYNSACARGCVCRLAGRSRRPGVGTTIDNWMQRGKEMWVCFAAVRPEPWLRPRLLTGNLCYKRRQHASAYFRSRGWKAYQCLATTHSTLQRRAQQLDLVQQEKGTHRSQSSTTRAVCTPEGHVVPHFRCHNLRVE